MVFPLIISILPISIPPTLANSLNRPVGGDSSLSPRTNRTKRSKKVKVSESKQPTSAEPTKKAKASSLDRYLVNQKPTDPKERSTSTRKKSSRKRPQRKKDPLATVRRLKHAPATNEQKLRQRDDVIIVDDLPTDDALARLNSHVDQLLTQIMRTGKPVFEIPSRSASNIIWDETSDILLLGKDLSQKSFHNLGSVADATRLMKVLEIIHEILRKNIHVTKRELFYNAVDLFQDQKNSDKAIEDASVLMRTTRNSTHIVAGAKGVAVGRIKIKDKGQVIDLQKMGSGAWNISPFLDQIEIVESDAEFVLVAEKEAAMIRLTEAEWWKAWPSIILTGKGLADIATRMFLKRITRELGIPAFCLVDADPYGHYIYSVYLRGSKRLSYESPFLATPNLKLLGVLSKDLNRYNIPKLARLSMTKFDLERTDQLLKEPFVKQRKEWVEDLKLMRTTKQKAEIQALAMHGFEYMTETYLPEKLTTGDWI